MIVCLCLGALLLTQLPDAAPPPSQQLSAAAFQRAFEAAFGAEDTDTIEALVRENPTRFVGLFENYAQVWIDWNGEPGARELKALEHARSIAEAADSVFAAPALLEVIEALQGFDDAKRERWRQAKKDYDAGVVLYNRFAWNEALGPFAKAESSFDEIMAFPRAAAAQESLGNCYYALGQHAKAIEYYGRSLALREKIGNPQDLAASLNNLGLGYRSLGQHAKAIDYHQRSLALFEKIGDVQGMDASLNNLGGCYFSLGQYDEAIARHERSLALKEKIGNPLDIAYSLNNLGICFFSLGQYEKAIAHHERCLALFAKIGNPQDIARSLGNLGSCYEPLGLYEKAIAHHERSLALFAKIGNPQDIAYSLGGLGICYFSLGQYDKAIEHHVRSLALKEKIGNPQDIATSLSDLGICYFALGQNDKATQYHERSLALFEKIGNPHDIARSLNNLGICYFFMGQAQRSIEYHERTLALKEKIGNPRAIAYSLGGLGICYFSVGQYDKAIQYHERSLALLESIGNPRDLAYSFHNLGHCHRARGQDEASLSCFERAVSQIKGVGCRFLSAEGRSAFAQKWTCIPAEVSGIARALLHAPRSRAIERSFALVESFFASTTLEGLQESAAGAIDRMDPELSREREHTLNRMVEQRLLLAREVSRLEQNSTRTDELRREITELEKALEALDQRLRQKNPRLKELIAPDAASLVSLQEKVLEEKDALLLFVLGEKESFVWVVTADNATVLALPGEQVLRDPYERLLGGLRETASPDLRFLSPARELFQLLLSPAWAFIAHKDNLIIIADGFLGFLPFEVLLTRDVSEQQADKLSALPYVLREKTVRYAPSASTLVFSAEHRPRAQSWQKDVLLLGDPVYGAERSRGPLSLRAAAALDPRRFDRLEKTRGEVQGIATALVSEQEASLLLELRDLKRSGHVSGSRFDLYVGEDASKERLNGNLTDYRLVHLAVHGFFDTQFPWFSGLILSDSMTKPGFMNLVEIATLKLSAEIVFLSACETARGQQLRAEGIRSTARSFLLAGAQSVVATQWNVMDDVAPIVASVFYEKLFAGVPAVDALRQAKLALIEQRARDRAAGPADAEHCSAHPSVWAPFVIWGG